MIKLITGGIGSGKTITAIKEIVRRNNKTFINFSTTLKGCHRLKIEDIVKVNVEKNEKGKETKTYEVNWNFWESAKRKGTFDIYIDEVHNVLNSRKSMTKWNTLAGIWISQIRKIFGSSESNHLYLLSQNLARVDVIARDLLYYIIFCNKVTYEEWKIDTLVLENGKLITKKMPMTFIFNYHFFGVDCVEKFQYWQYRGLKTYDLKTYFIANQYYRFYDSYQLVKFGEEVYI